MHLHSINVSQEGDMLNMQPHWLHSQATHDCKTRQYISRNLHACMLITPWYYLMPFHLTKLNQVCGPRCSGTLFPSRPKLRYCHCTTFTLRVFKQLVLRIRMTVLVDVLMFRSSISRSKIEEEEIHHYVKCTSSLFQ